MNLNAVFWDLPKFKDENYLREFLKEQKGKVPYYWAMKRFLQYGRIVDTFDFFDIKEISENLDKFRKATEPVYQYFIEKGYFSEEDIIRAKASISD